MQQQLDGWFYPKLNNNDGQAKAYPLPTSKVVCVGRNYLEHARELNNPVPSQPLLFIKPNSSLRDVSLPVVIPEHLGECHHELELALLIGKKASQIEISHALDVIEGYGVALDLTLRDMQTQLKSKGQPWEKAKAFDGACVVSEFLPYTQNTDLKQKSFNLFINQALVQAGDTRDMIFTIPELIAAASQHFTLYPGDILLTGTPAGVGPLSPGNELRLTLDGHQWQTSVAGGSDNG